jgi:hypothetical protein
MPIDRLLSGAVRLWLQSQVSAIEDLTLKIIGKNKQIIQGYIPQIFISANNTIYQGIEISKLEIVGNNIKFNLPQVVKRKPLQLLEPVKIEIEVFLKEIDLQKSLSSSLLAIGLTDLWSRFLMPDLASLDPKNLLYQWNYLSLSESRLFFSGNAKKLEYDDLPIAIDTRIELKNSHTLLLSPIKIITLTELSITETENLTLDLGKQVSIAQLEITEEHLLVRGTITVFP